jgi:hypothetical protein
MAISIILSICAPLNFRLLILFQKLKIEEKKVYRGKSYANSD